MVSKFDRRESRRGKGSFVRIRGVESSCVVGVSEYEVRNLRRYVGHGGLKQTAMGAKLTMKRYMYNPRKGQYLVCSLNFLIFMHDV